jgi:hypothetical protein
MGLNFRNGINDFVGFAQKAGKTIKHVADSVGDIKNIYDTGKTIYNTAKIIAPIVGALI